MTEINPSCLPCPTFLKSSPYMRIANKSPLDEKGPRDLTEDRSGISAGPSVLACECLEGLHTIKHPKF